MIGSERDSIINRGETEYLAGNATHQAKPKLRATVRFELGSCRWIGVAGINAAECILQTTLAQNRMEAMRLPLARIEDTVEGSFEGRCPQHCLYCRR